MLRFTITLNILIFSFVFFLSSVQADISHTVWPTITDLSGTDRITKTSFQSELPHVGSITGLLFPKSVIENPSLHDEQIIKISDAGYEVYGGLLVDEFIDGMPPNDPEVLWTLRQIERGVAILADRYNGYTMDQFGRILPRIEYWRVGNEVNHGQNAGTNFWIDPEHYALVLERVKPYIEQNQGKVLMSMAGGNTQIFTDYLISVHDFDENFLENVDLFDIHIYGPSFKDNTPGVLNYLGLEEVPLAIDALISIWGAPAASYCTQEQATYSGTPVIDQQINNFVQRYPLQTDHEHGSDLVRRLVLSSAKHYNHIAVPPIDGVNWNDRYWSHIGLAHDGAYANDRGYEVRKPAFFATQRLDHLLREMTSVSTIPLPPTIRAYSFSDSLNQVNILWQDGDPAGLINVGYLGDEIVNLVRPQLTKNTGTIMLDNDPIAVISAYTVGQSGYPTIQSAVDAAASNGGGIIVVEPGIYREHVTLYDDVHLYGRQMDRTIIEGWVWTNKKQSVVISQLTVRSEPGELDTLVQMTCCSGMISNCCLEGGQTGIFVNDSGFQIARCTFKNNHYGIYSDSHTHITNCLFDGCSIGIVPVDSSGPTIVNNVFFNNTLGVILLPGIQRGRICSNIFYKNQNALEFCVGTDNLEYLPIFYNDLFPDPPQAIKDQLSGSPARLVSSHSGPFNVNDKQLRLRINAVQSDDLAEVIVVQFIGTTKVWTAEMVAATIDTVISSQGLGSSFVENGLVVVQTDLTGPTSSLRADYSYVLNDPENAAGDIGFPKYAVIGSGNNIFANPQFVNPSKRNFHLFLGSPCINAGNPSGIVNDINGSRNDMGLWGGPESNY